MSPAARSKQQSSAVLKTPAASTVPRPRTCATCQARTLEARTTAGLEVVVDAAPLSALGELAAVLDRVATYTHHLVQGELAHRYPLVIRSRPAGAAPRQTVHAQHRCGSTWPALPPPARVRTTPDDDRPPF